MTPDDAPIVTPTSAPEVVAVILHGPPLWGVGDAVCAVKGYTEGGRYMVCSRETGHADEHWDGFDGVWWVVG